MGFRMSFALAALFAAQAVHGEVSVERGEDGRLALRRDGRTFATVDAAEMKPYRRGDLRFKADSVLRREVSGWQDIPFDKIGLFRDEWRTEPEPEVGPAPDFEDDVRAAVDECARLQARLKDRCSLADYRARVVSRGGTNVWTAALQAALDEHEIVGIPAAAAPYWIDAPVVVPSGRRIEADGATVSLLPGVRTVMLRNANAADGTLAPLRGARNDNIAIVGGRWTDWPGRRLGNGASGRFNDQPREAGNFFGVSALVYFGACDHLTIRDATFVGCSAFAIQVGDGDAMAFERIRFAGCHADGLHLNGNLSRVLARDVKGAVGDDLVALNAYDWLNSSVNFGPQRDIVCEDLELVPETGAGYSAIRILPACFRYADGSVVDCSISNVVFRKVRGVNAFKMYLQTPVYRIGEAPEWSRIGSGGNIRFEDIEIDLDAPIDNFGQYASSDPVRGHFGAFEFGANLSSVRFKDIVIRFHADRWPHSHLATVGPKSIAGGGQEVFDPYASCHVGLMTLENVRLDGVVPKELVHETRFDDVNGDGRSSGAGTVGRILGL